MRLTTSHCKNKGVQKRHTGPRNRTDNLERTWQHRGIIANAHIKIGSNSYKKVETFKYLGSLLTNQNSIQEEIIPKAGNSCYYSVQTLLPSRLLSKN